MNFHAKMNKKWSMLPFLARVAVMAAVGMPGVYTLSGTPAAAQERVNVRPARGMSGLSVRNPLRQEAGSVENVAEKAENEPLNLDSLLKNSVARRDTDGISAPAAASVAPTAGNTPKAHSPAGASPFALPDDFMVENFADQEYPKLAGPADQDPTAYPEVTGVAEEGFFLAAKASEKGNLTEQEAEAIPGPAEKSVPFADAPDAPLSIPAETDEPASLPASLSMFPDEKSLDISPVEPAESVSLKNPQSRELKIREKGAEKEASAVNVPKLRKRTSSSGSTLRSRPTFSADPYQSRPYYTPYVPTTGPGVLVTPR